MKKLILFDMDGVIFDAPDFWLNLHKAYGTINEGSELTKKYLKTDYELLVREVVGRLWKNKPADVYFKMINESKYMPGAVETLKVLKSRGYKIAIISSGPWDLAQRAKKDADIDYVYAHKLVTENGKVAGSTDMRNWPIRNNNKGEIMKRLCEEHNIDYKDCIVVCNGDNDIKMARTAGLAIAFCPVEEEIKKYCNLLIETKDLTLILGPIADFDKQQIDI